MQKFIDIAVEVGRLAAVGTAMLSLVITGFGTVDRMPPKPETVTEITVEPVIVPEVPTDEALLEESDQVADGEDSSENMTPSGKPNCEPVACLVSADVYKTDNSNGRNRVDAQKQKAVRVTTSPGVVRGSVCTSCARVKPSLGRQFTLVGARPSGTG